MFGGGKKLHTFLARRQSTLPTSNAIDLLQCNTSLLPGSPSIHLFSLTPNITRYEASSAETVLEGLAWVQLAASCAHANLDMAVEFTGLVSKSYCSQHIFMHQRLVCLLFGFATKITYQVCMVHNTRDSFKYIKVKCQWCKKSISKASNVKGSISPTQYFHHAHDPVPKQYTRNLTFL